MYVYIYDQIINSKNYQSLTAKIETRLTDLGLNGKIVRLNPMHNLERTIKDEVKSNCTIVLVGNDSLINSAFGILKGLDVTIGIIPIGKNGNNLARTYGINSEMEACNILAARKIAHLDLGVANNSVFLNHLSIKSSKSFIESADNLTLETNSPSIITIKCLSSTEDYGASISNDSHRLQLTINSSIKNHYLSKPTTSTTSIISSKFLINGNFSATLDDCITLSAPITVSVLKNGAKIIIGRYRL
ncbi:MAG: diacylglycerol kinase family protein [bacterium]